MPCLIWVGFALDAAAGLESKASLLAAALLFACKQKWQNQTRL